MPAPTITIRGRTRAGPRPCPAPHAARWPERLPPERRSAIYGRAMPANRASGMPMKITLDPSMAPGLHSCPSGGDVAACRVWPRVQRGGQPLAELVPAGLERAYSLVFQHSHHVVVVDAERGEFAEHALRLVIGAVDAVIGDLPVVGDRVEDGL